MMCCGAIEWEKDEVVNGEREHCGAETIDMEARDQCSYSPTCKDYKK